MDDDPWVPTDVWMNERLDVRDSPIEGSGLFFTSDLPAGTIVIRLVSSAELDVLLIRAQDDPYVDTITVCRDAHLVLPASTPIHFGNHCCDPTLWLVEPLEIATRRDVSNGEEATLDYATISGADGFRMACRCGSRECRGDVTSGDWRRAELQERYLGHWSPALQDRIDSV